MGAGQGPGKAEVKPAAYLWGTTHEEYAALASEAGLAAALQAPVTEGSAFLPAKPSAPSKALGGR